MLCRSLRGRITFGIVTSTGSHGSVGHCWRDHLPCWISLEEGLHSLLPVCGQRIATAVEVIRECARAEDVTTGARRRSPMVRLIEPHQSTIFGCSGTETWITRADTPHHRHEGLLRAWLSKVEGGGGLPVPPETKLGVTKCLRHSITQQGRSAQSLRCSVVTFMAGSLVLSMLVAMPHGLVRAAVELASESGNALVV